MNVLLIGGNGFLGKGLQKELILRNIKFKSIDKDDIDIYDSINVSKLVDILKNYDNIVLLASKIGVTLFETDPKNAGLYNEMIFENFITSLKIASKKYNKSFSVTYYSTSEVYGSSCNITKNSEYHFDFENPRYIYAFNKYRAEKELFKLNNEHPEIISFVKILRPFNIFGINQTRGVVYEMVKTAIEERKIYYKKNTTRTFTDIDLCSKMSADTILLNKNLKINIVDNRNSLTLKSLAKIINDVLNLNCEYVELVEDHSIQYRQTSIVDQDVELSKFIMKPHIIDIANQLKK